MSIIDDYKQLQMIENIKKIKELELCYKANLKLCKQQEKQINKLATCIERIKEIASKVLLNTHDLEQFKDADALFGSLLEIHKKISEVENGCI